ncbi:MAG: hypothetical protein KGJ13_02480 [Patescibacteria group bacterium]|nr:hypothetical protein [Patescibacteria group bacterium]
MPLPTQVVEKLAREPVKTPGWSGGILFYSGGLLVIVIALYLGLAAVYTPILNAQISGTQNQINQLNQSISSADQQKILAYYSELSNLKNLVNKHTAFANFLSWLESRTEANVSYTGFSFASGNQVTLNGTAKTTADLNQQMAIFQSDPEVKSVSLSNVIMPVAGGIPQFNLSLLMNPAIFSAQHP